MRLTIKTKLIASFAVILALTGGSGYVALTSLQAANDDMQEFIDEPFAQVQNGRAMRQRVTELRRAVRNIYMVDDPAKRAEIAATTEETIAELETLRKNLFAAMTPQQRQDYADINELSAAFTPAVRRSIELSMLAHPNPAILVMNGLRESFIGFQAELTGLSDELRALADQSPEALAATGVPTRDLIRAIDLAGTAATEANWSVLRTVAAAVRMDTESVQASLASADGHIATVDDALDLR